MEKTKLIVELGTGVDMHGGNCTKAAKRAVDDAIHHGSLLIFGEIMKSGARPKMYVDVTIAAPKPDEVDGDAVLEALPFGEKTIIETIVEKVVSSKVNHTLVVLGSEREKVEKKIMNFPVKVAFNPDYPSGMLSSVLCGFKSLPGDTQAVVVVLGDQPSVSKEVIDKIVDAYQSTGKGIVLPVYQKERGHPVVIDMKYKDEIENLSPDIGLRGTVYSHPPDVDRQSLRH